MFQTQLARNGLNGVEANVLAQQHLDDTAFKALTDDIEACLAAAKVGQTSKFDRPYAIVLKGMEDQHGPLIPAG